MIHQDRFPTVEELGRKTEDYHRKLKKKREPNEMDINKLNQKKLSDIRIAVKKICTKDIGHKNDKL